MTDRQDSGLFRVLLRHHRQRCAMSQLDLALTAGVSARHISFLETGRAAPSREMALRLSAALGLGPRETNALLRAAGLPRAFHDSAPEQPWPPAIERVVARMLEHHEPYPMVVLDGRFDVVRANRAAGALFTRFVLDASALTTPANLFQTLFDPRLFRPFIENWSQVARLTLTYLQREVVANPSNTALAKLLREVLAYPGVPESWREPEWELPASATLEFAIARDGERLSFLTTVTTFNTVLDVGIEDLKLESYFPADEVTEALCRKAAGR